MRPCRILSLWFPRLAAERLLRAEPALAGRPLAVVADHRGALVLASLTAAAEAAGLRRGMALGDARAICPGSSPAPPTPPASPAPRGALRRWAGRFTPWVAEEEAGAGPRRHRLRAALRRRGRARRPGRGRGRRLRLHRSASASPTPSGAAWAVARYAGASALVRPCRRRDRAGGARHPLARPEAALGARRAAAAGRPRTGGRLRASSRPARRSRTSSRCRWRRCGSIRPRWRRCRRSGSRRIGELAALPRAAVARRFGPERRAAARPGARPDPRAGVAGAARAGVRAAPDLPRADRPRARTSSPASTGCCRRSAPGCAPPARARAGCG